jgi:RNA polymerase sigma factor (sigma-70 family)
MRRKDRLSAELETLYRKRFPVFVRCATAVLRDGDAGLDVVQEAFARALRRRKTFRGDGSLEAWVWQIVLNVARDRLRARGRESRTFAPESVPATASDVHEDLHGYLVALPERQRLAVFLRYYADLSYTQIADVIGITPGTVAASLNTAHGVLRRQLQEVAK